MFLVRQKFIKNSKIYILYIFVLVYKSFSATLDKGLRKNIKRKKKVEEMEKLKNTKWNESTEYESEKVKQTK